MGRNLHLSSHLREIIIYFTQSLAGYQIAIDQAMASRKEDIHDTSMSLSRSGWPIVRETRLSTRTTHATDTIRLPVASKSLANLSRDVKLPPRIEETDQPRS